MKRAKFASNTDFATAALDQAMKAPLGATLSEEEREGYNCEAEKIKKDLAEMESKTPRAQAKMKRAELFRTPIPQKPPWTKPCKPQWKLLYRRRKGKDTKPRRKISKKAFQKWSQKLTVGGPK